MCIRDSPLHPYMPVIGRCRPLILHGFPGVRPRARGPRQGGRAATDHRVLQHPHTKPHHS
eukprot:15348885-Alexandrium_andersonii.AAC.1